MNMRVNSAGEGYPRFRFGPTAAAETAAALAHLRDILRDFDVLDGTIGIEDDFMPANQQQRLIRQAL